MRGKMMLVLAAVALVAFSADGRLEEMRLPEEEREAELRFRRVERLNIEPKSPSWPESFEAVFPPDGWLVVNNDGGAREWTQHTTAHTGNYSASCRWESSVLRNDDWLITPQLVLETGVTDTLTFWYRAFSAGWPESLEVRLSTTGTDVADFTELVWASTFNHTVWEDTVLNLDAWDGNNVYIAFVYVSLNEFRVFLDDVSGPPFFVPDYDVGVTSIITPTGLALEGDVNPEVVVANFGLLEATFPVTFQISPDDYASTVNVTLSPGQIDTVIFPDPFTATPGSYSTLAYTALVGDQNLANDSLPGMFIVVEYVEDFELTDGGFESVVISNEPPAEWEWGIIAAGDYVGGNPPGPDAHSGVRGWGTGLTGDYLNFANYYMWNEFIATGPNPTILFYHWYNIWAPFDGGNVKLSIDDGNTWTVISPVGGYDYLGGAHTFYDSIFGGEQLYWDVEIFELAPHGIVDGQVFRVKWHMMSSTVIGDYPGWYVDDVGGADLIPFVPAHDVGIAEIVSPTGLILDGDMITPEVVIQNLGPLPDTVDVTLMINTLYQEIVTVVIEPETTLTVFFPEWTAVAGSYDVTAYTFLAADENPANDTMSVPLIVASWVEDFEHGIWPPLAWADYQLGEAIDGWQQFYAGASGSSGDPIGNYGAWHDDEAVAAPGCDDWLVTSAYRVMPDAHLYFYQRTRHTPDEHKLYISTGSGVPPVDFVELQDLSDVTSADWMMYGPVDLSAYVGSQIYLAWVYRGRVWHSEWYLDDIIGVNLIPMIPYDVALMGIQEDIADTLTQGSLLHPSSIVANNSPLGGPALSFRIHYKIQKDGNLYWQKVSDVIDLPPATVDTVYFGGDVIFNEPGDYTVMVTIQTAFVDPVPGNNVLPPRLIHVTPGKGSAQEQGLPKVFVLHQNVPNPARGNTFISYAIPRRSDVTIRIYDISGRLVRRLVNLTREPGYYTERWDMRDDRGRKVGAGIYFYKLDAGDFNSVRKMVVIGQ